MFLELYFLEFKDTRETRKIKRLQKLRNLQYFFDLGYDFQFEGILCNILYTEPWLSESKAGGHGLYINVYACHQIN